MHTLALIIAIWLAVVFTWAFGWWGMCAMHDWLQRRHVDRALAGDPKAIRKLVHR